MKKLLFPFAFLVLALVGCASVPPVTPGPKITAKPQISGIYHRVEKGQTLWMISRIYGADLDELIKVNHITDTSNILTGEMIFIPDYLRSPATQKANLDDFSWPARGKTAKNRINHGIDIMPLPSHNISAAANGKVIFLDPDFPGYGLTIIIGHNHGFQTVYSGQMESRVKLGDAVAKGSLIAKLKNDNAYLHFEIRKNGSAQNPNFYLAQ